MIDFDGLRARIVTALEARGFDPTNPDAVAQGRFMDAICNSFVNAWTVSITVPGNGPLAPPPTQPHTHLIAPGTLTSPILLAAMAAGLVPPFIPNFGWDWLASAWTGGVGTHIVVALTDVQDGNNPAHTHSWFVFNKDTLKSLVLAPLSANPNLDLANVNSKLEDYVDGISEALADAILNDGTTGVPVPVGTVHTHVLL